MSLFRMVERHKQFVQGDIDSGQLRAEESALTEHVKETMREGGDKLDFIFGRDKTWLYYTIASVVASLALDDASEDDVELITKVTPAIVNWIAGASDEIGLNKNAQYSIVLGKDRQ